MRHVLDRVKKGKSRECAIAIIFHQSHPNDQRCDPIAVSAGVPEHDSKVNFLTFRKWY
jgi:hypothetical protein